LKGNRYTKFLEEIVREIIIVHVDLKKNYDKENYIERSFDMILDREFNFVLFQEIQSIFHDFTRDSIQITEITINIFLETTRGKNDD